jgi:hypothetical protein
LLALVRGPFSVWRHAVPRHHAIVLAALAAQACGARTGLEEKVTPSLPEASTSDAKVGVPQGLGGVPRVDASVGAADASMGCLNPTISVTTPGAVGCNATFEITNVGGEGGTPTSAIVCTPSITGCPATSDAGPDVCVYSVSGIEGMYVTVRVSEAGFASAFVNDLAGGCDYPYPPEGGEVTLKPDEVDGGAGTDAETVD